MNFDDIVLEFDGGSTPSRKPAALDASRNLTDQLVSAMLNERLSPALLPYKHDLLQTVLSRISSQQQLLLDSHEYGDTNADSGMISGDFKLQLMIIETDIERLSYVVKLYLRARLAKIDNFTIHYINIVGEESDDRPSLLSDPEISYMQQHFKILTLLYNASFLRKMPPSLALLDESIAGQNMVVEPEYNRPVFIKCKSYNPIFIQLGGDEELQLDRDGIYVVRYNLIQRYLEIGDVELI